MPKTTLCESPPFFAYLCDTTLLDIPFPETPLLDTAPPFLSIKDDIATLLSQGVIDSPTAERLREYYGTSGKSSPARQHTVFAILGAMLVGLGLILIVAHNWDTLSQTSRLILSCLPMLLSQLACGYTLAKRADSAGWREGSAVALVLSVGACIAMVSQVYHIEGSLSGFVLLWCILALPVVYVMRSYLASMLVLIGITWYGAEIAYFGYAREAETNWYPLLLLALAPYMTWLFVRRPRSNAATLHGWLLPISLIIMLGEYVHPQEVYLLPAYMALASIFYLHGLAVSEQGVRLRSNGFLVLGSLTTIVCLITASFSWYWEEAYFFARDRTVDVPHLGVMILLGVIAIVMLIRRRIGRPLKDIHPVEAVYVVFLALSLLGLISPLVFLLVNVLILAVSLLTIREGLRQDHLGILNYGLLILMALVVARFFDGEWSFVVRGLLFIAVGVGFFLANMKLIRKRRQRDEV